MHVYAGGFGTKILDQVKQKKEFGLSQIYPKERKVLRLTKFSPSQITKSDFGTIVPKLNTGNIIIG